MTILNVWVGRDRALVAVDTFALHPDAGKTIDDSVVPAYFEATKLFPIAAANAVLAGRGEAGLMWTVHIGCLMNGADYDVLTDKMPGILAGAVKAFEASQPLWKRRPAGALQIVLVGWSPRHERMLGVVFERDGPGQPFVRTELGGTDSDGGEESDDWIAPWEPEQGEAPVPDSPGAMVLLAAEQMAYAPEGAPIGGRLLVAELGRDTLSVQALCDLGGLPAGERPVPQATERPAMVAFGGSRTRPALSVSPSC